MWAELWPIKKKIILRPDESRGPEGSQTSNPIIKKLYTSVALFYFVAKKGHIS